jgi:hypothetical protein
MTKALIIRLVIGVLAGGGLGALVGYYGRCTSGACPLTATPYRGAIYGALMGLLFAYSLAGGHSSRATGKTSEPPETPAVDKEK